MRHLSPDHDAGLLFPAMVFDDADETTSARIVWNPHIHTYVMEFLRLFRRESVAKYLPRAKRAVTRARARARARPPAAGEGGEGQRAKWRAHARCEPHDVVDAARDLDEERRGDASDEAFEVRLGVVHDREADRGPEPSSIGRAVEAERRDREREARRDREGPPGAEHHESTNPKL